MMLNTLYALLVDGKGVTSASNYYKRTTPVFHTNRTRAIRDILEYSVPNERVDLFAAVVCDVVRYTKYGADIYAIDSQNTYCPVVRVAAAQTQGGGPNAAHCMYDLTHPIERYSELKRYLSDELRADLSSAATWVDIMAVGCLQMLRDYTDGR